MYAASFQENFQINSNPLNKRFTLLEGFAKPYLGWPAIEALQVVKKVDPIQINSIVKQFSELFKLKDNYKM